MKVGDYVRTKQGIEKIKVVEENFMDDKDCIFYATDNKEWNGAYNGKYNGFTNRNRTIIKSSPNILELLEPMDLLYIDIDDGIVVPRMPETLKELNDFIEFIKSGHWILKGVVTHEQLESMKYEVE